jgi:hypothetical protein
MPAITSYVTDLVDQINKINQDAQNKANAGRIPGGAGLELTSSGNISNALAGNLDPSVIQKLGQSSAERGIMTGSPSGPGTQAEYLKSLGLTTLDLQNQGQKWLTDALARNPAAPIYNAGNQVLTAEQLAQQQAEQQRLLLEQQKLNLEASLRHPAPGPGPGPGNVKNTNTTTGGPPPINWSDLLGGGGGGGGGTNTNLSGWTPGSWSNTNPSDGAWGGSSSFIGDPWNDPNQPIFQPAGYGPTSDFTDPTDPGYWASDVMGGN